MITAWNRKTKFNIKPQPYKYKGKFYDNNIFCLDIETSSGFIEKGKKEVIAFDSSIFNGDSKKIKEYYNSLIPVGLCYMWQLAVNDTYYFGRSLFDLPYVFKQIEEIVGNRYTVWVHNLAFEFEWLLNVLKFDNVFARKAHKVIYADVGLCRLRCSYFLTRLSLAAWGKKVGVKKLTEIMDYNVIRTPYTLLPQNLLDYGENDVKIMYYGIKEFIQEYDNIENIPLTQTGQVRREVKELYNKDYDYHVLMTKLIPRQWADYKVLKDTYIGAITHGNRFYLNKIIEDVESWDLSSSYPACMVLEKYPITYFTKMSNDMYCKICGNDDYSYILDITFYDIKSVVAHTYISFSKCIKKDTIKVVKDNGRVLKAEQIRIYITNVDFDCIKMGYSFYDFKINSIWVARNARLDKRLIVYSLDLYKNKTSLKGILEQEEIYAKSKEFINSLYGMCVTDIIQKNIAFYNGEWSEEEITPELYNDKISKKIENVWNNFNAYQFGIYITAYARRNLWEMAVRIDRDDYYMDTDSHKCKKGYKYLFEEYNKRVQEKINVASTQLDIPVESFSAIDKNGIKHTIGFYEHDDSYKKFKYLGAKRYAYEQDGEIHITVSGVNKSKGALQLKSLDEFDYKLVFDFEHTGKLLMRYNENIPQGIIWNKGKYDEYKSNFKYGICATPTTYSMSPVETSLEDFKELLIKTIIERMI